MKSLHPSPTIVEVDAGASAAARPAALKVLIIVGHPRKASFCGALARAYRKGAAQAILSGLS